MVGVTDPEVTKTKPQKDEYYIQVISVVRVHPCY